MSTTVQIGTDIRPFHLEVPDEDLAELRRRIAATRWPSNELVEDRSQGVQLATAQELARYWTTDYDWRKAEAKLNALPQFTTEIDGVEIHFIHVRSEHENALPLIMTHGWPGSVIEMLDSVGPLTDPTAHGGSAEDAFHLVLPSLPGYGLSGEPAEVGWDLGRTARAWAELMRRLGYTRYVAQGGDVGAGVTDAMGRLAPEGLVGIHTNLLVPALGGTDADGYGRGTRRGGADRDLRAVRERLLRRDGDPTADDRLRPARLSRRPGRLDDRPRHRRLQQDRARLRRRAALGQPHARPHPRQHHAVLADRHRRLRGSVVLGGLRARRPGRRQSGPASRRRSRSASRRSRARSGGPRAAGSRRATRTSSTSTRSTRAATSPRGKSRRSSHRNCERRSGHSADRTRAACTRIARRVGTRRRDERRTWQRQKVLTILPPSTSSTVRLRTERQIGRAPASDRCRWAHEGWCEMSLLSGLRRHFPCRRRATCPGSTGRPAGSTHRLSRRRTCARRWCSSTSGRTPASTGCARSPTSAPGPRSTVESGLLVVGVHTPEFPFERDIDNVRRGRERPERRVSDRARQQLRGLAGVQQPVLAGRLHRRRRRTNPAPPIRRGRIRRLRTRHPATAARSRSRGRP